MRGQTKSKTYHGLSQRVFVAMSGGVDSSVTAALLKKRGFEVTGVHIKMWSDPDIPCNFKEDRYDAMRVAAKLDIPFETWDFTKEYKQAVVEYMIGEYAAGRTPNPDVMCNNRIKFGVFLNRALEMGADYIATGHYVRKSEIRNPKSETISKSKIFNRKRVLNLKNSNLEFVSNFDIHASNFSLQIAKDRNKDQSYFLWTLMQEQLKHCIFPIGGYTKPEVRKLARRFGLPTAEKPDSQGICFMGEIDVRDFLRKYIPVERGRVLTTSGKTIGEHDGLSFYTIGQRHGLGIGGRPRSQNELGEPRPKGAGGIPYYVAGKDSNTNTLLVAEGPYDEKLFSSELAATDLNWISGREPKFPLQCEARIRYRQPLQHCSVEAQKMPTLRGITQNPVVLVQKNADSTRKHAEKILRPYASICVRFAEPQRAVTPGQSIVFYKKGAMLGGGIIC